MLQNRHRHLDVITDGNMPLARVLQQDEQRGLKRLQGRPSELQRQIGGVCKEKGRPPVVENNYNETVRDGETCASEMQTDKTK